jgi:hypothetical protein
VTLEPIETVRDDLKIRAREQQNYLEALAEAYEQSVASLVFRTRFLQFGSLALALITLAIQFLIGNRQSAMSDWVGRTQLILAVSLAVTGIWALVYQWDGMLEKQREIVAALIHLVSEYSISTTSESITLKKMKDWEQKRVVLETLRKHKHARIQQQFFQAGYCHVAKKYPQFGITCNECQRIWKTEYAHQTGWAFLPWIRKCRNCGIILNDRKTIRDRV